MVRRWVERWRSRAGYAPAHVWLPAGRTLPGEPSRPRLGRAPRLEDVGHPGARAAEFAAIMGVALEIAAREPAALAQLVQLLARKLQADAINLRLVDRESWGSWDNDPRCMWFDISQAITPDGRYFDDLYADTDERWEVSLASTAVLTGPWSRGRLVNSLCAIGEGRRDGAWREDPANHSAILWQPFGVVTAVGGNHSIAAGIALGAGTLHTEVTRDVSPLYRHVYCDGRRFIRRADMVSLGVVRNVHWAAIFEIGRLMLRHRGRRG